MKYYPDIVDELDAKAWQASGPAKGRHHDTHVCYRAAREIVRLREIVDATEAEKGWRTFWHAFSEYLHLGHEQRTYTWHNLQDACVKGMDAVKKYAATTKAE